MDTHYSVSHHIYILEMGVLCQYPVLLSVMPLSSRKYHQDVWEPETQMVVVGRCTLEVDCLVAVGGWNLDLGLGWAPSVPLLEFVAHMLAASQTFEHLAYNDHHLLGIQLSLLCDRGARKIAALVSEVGEMVHNLEQL